MHRNATAAMKLPHPHRILLVEDHRAMREAVAELLQADDQLDVLAAVESAEEALELIGSHGHGLPVDLAVVDLNLPGMHGLQLVAELDRRAHIPVVVLSSHSSDRYGPVARDAGARAYVEKIRAASDLIETVRQVLELPARDGFGKPRYTAANSNRRPDEGVEEGYETGRPLDDGFDGGPLRYA